MIVTQSRDIVLSHGVCKLLLPITRVEIFINLSIYATLLSLCVQIGHNHYIIASNLASKYLLNDFKIPNGGQNIICVSLIEYFGTCHAVIKYNNFGVDSSIQVYDHSVKFKL